jgi:hypothetical protein
MTPRNSVADGHEHKQCYVPNGGLGSGMPCHPEQDVSLCCPFGWSCLSNGLCRPSIANDRDYLSHVFRFGCTDHSWNSPNCTQVCRGCMLRHSNFCDRNADIFLADDNLDGPQGVRVCNEAAGTYCCQRDFDCCSNSSLILNLGQATNVRTIVRPTSLPSDQDEAVKRSSIAKEVVIGIAGGFSIAALVFVMCWTYIIYQRRRRLRLAQMKDDEKQKGPKELDAVEPSMKFERRSSYMLPGDSANPVELDSTNTRSELDTRSSRIEPSRMNSFATTNTASAISPLSDTATLVTPIVMELEAPYKIDRRPTSPG